MKPMRSIAGELVYLEDPRFPIIGDGGIIIFEESGSDRLWTPCNLRDGWRNFGRIKPYDGPRPAEKTPLS